MSVARAVSLQPLKERQIPITRRALVVGGGVAGMNAALGIADQGYEVVLVEKEGEVGGLANRLTKTIEGADIGAYVAELAEQVKNHEQIQVLTNSLIVDFSGFKGNFTTEVLVGPGMYERKIEHGVLILATGADPYEPEEFLYGESPAVCTQLEMGDRLEKEGAEGLDQVVMLQCVGSRNEENPNCSRICCQSAVKNAIHIKKENPEAQVYVLYRDIRTYGLLEDYYTEARQLGVIFSRFDEDAPPQAVASGDKVTVTFHDHILDRDLSVDADALVLSTGMRAADTEELASIMKLGRNPENYFIEAHVKLRPVDLGTEGIFVCGTAHSPKLISESVSQAYAAAARATTYLAQPHLTLSAVTARVDQDRCAACLICVRTCPYGVPRINEEGVSEIDDALCQGCGACAAECPAKAIELSWYEDQQLLSKVDALLEDIL
jgi:heterodisulfide reductase subunit A-like polyferredoxin